MIQTNFSKSCILYYLTQSTLTSVRIAARWHCTRCKVCKNFNCVLLFAPLYQRLYTATHLASSSTFWYLRGVFCDAFSITERHCSHSHSIHFLHGSQRPSKGPLATISLIIRCGTDHNGWLKIILQTKFLD